ncbi:MAG: AAA family ATPase [Thiotrichales bacterium]|jgi:DNA repair exonuclease SbcCD ATPase subunit|nr:AAA family ATPase [Thiotrichales bacterium]
MINFKSVTVQNFLSYGAQPTTFDLSTEGSTLILGNNEDVGETGNSKNGVGKTASMQAVLFALFGRGIDKLKTDEFINIKNEKRLVVDLVFEKDGKNYRIIRKRKPNALELYVEDQAVTLDTMANTDKMIESIVGTYDIFMTAYFLTPHRESFLSMSSTDQRNLIEEMLSLDILAERAEALKLIRKELEVECRVLERDIANARQQNANTESNIQRMLEKRNSLEMQTASEIAEVESDIKEFEQIDIDAITTELNLQQVNITEIAQLNQELNELNFQYVSTKVRLSEVDSEINILETADADIKAMRAKALQFENNIISEREVLESQAQNAKKLYGIEFDLNEQSIQRLLDTYTEKYDVLAEIIEVINELADADRSIDTLKAKIDRNASEIEDLKREIEHLEDGKCPTCNQDYCDHSKIETLQAKLIKKLGDVEKDNQDVERLITETTIARAEVNAFLAESGIDVDADLKLLNRENATVIKHLTSIMSDVRLFESKAATNTYKDRLVELESRFGNIVESVSELEDEYTLIEKEMLRLTDRISEIKETIGELESTPYPLLAKFKIKSDHDVARIIEKLEALKAKLLSLKQTDYSLFDNEIAEFKTQLIDVSAIAADLKEIQTQIEHANILIKLLTNNSSFIRKGIVDKYIPFINKRIYEYTEILGLKHLVTVSNDLTSEILYMNRSVSYFNLSQGERLRVNLAMSLAFRDLVSSLGKQTNALFIDEFLDAGGDTSFVYSAIKLVTTKAKHVDVISHRTDIIDFVDNVMTITKRNGFSFIE